MPAATGMPKPTERTSAPSRLRTIRGATSPRSPVALDWRVAPPLLGAEHPLNCTNVPPLLSHHFPFDIYRGLSAASEIV